MNAQMKKFSIREACAKKAVRWGLLAVILLSIIAAGIVWHRADARRQAMAIAGQQVDTMALRITECLGNIEQATHEMEPVITANLQPDSLLVYTRRVVERHPDIKGCSITMEPDFFKTLGHNFSAYSVREGDSIATVIEGDYDYYSKEWYYYPREKGKPVWVDPYDDFNAGTLSSTELIASYSVPLYDTARKLVGVIATDIALPTLAKVVAGSTPFPGAYWMVTGKKGNYLVYPDKERLVYHTIFDGVNPRFQPDIIKLGRDMIDGHYGYSSVDFDGEKCLVFYRPLKQAGWSIALICPERHM